MKSVKLITIVGARPQFIKMLPLSGALTEMNIKEVVVHTGQHYDYEMSQIFFDTMNIKKPDYHLGIGSAPHGAQTGRMMEKIEEVLLKEKPNGVVVFGDTNSTLAGALAAVKLHIPVFHVEAGLRSFNKKMPEEINRVLTDHISDLLFAPTKKAVENLKREGLTEGIFLVGDIMYDTYLIFKEKYLEHSEIILKRWNLREKEYGIVTIHREENTEDDKRFESILAALKDIVRRGIKLIFPLHPRLKGRITQKIDGLIITKPLSYIDVQALLSRASVVLTDSGGLQKEAYFHNVPCITLRNETEWVELEESGINFVSGTEREKIVEVFDMIRKNKIRFKKGLYGNGKTAFKIASKIKEFMEEK